MTKKEAFDILFLEPERFCMTSTSSLPGQSSKSKKETARKVYYGKRKYAQMLKLQKEAWTLDGQR